MNLEALVDGPAPLAPGSSDFDREMKSGSVCALPRWLEEFDVTQYITRAFTIT